MVLNPLNDGFENLGNSSKTLMSFIFSILKVCFLKKKKKKYVLKVILQEVCISFSVAESQWYSVGLTVQYIGPMVSICCILVRINLARSHLGFSLTELERHLKKHLV